MKYRKDGRVYKLVVVGHWGCCKRCCFYDENAETIEGGCLVFTDKSFDCALEKPGYFRETIPSKIRGWLRSNG